MFDFVGLKSVASNKIASKINWRSQPSGSVSPASPLERTGFDGMDRSPFDNGLKGPRWYLRPSTTERGGSEDGSYYNRDRFGKERVPAPRV